MSRGYDGRRRSSESNETVAGGGNVSIRNEKVARDGNDSDVSMTPILICVTTSVLCMGLLCIVHDNACI